MAPRPVPTNIVELRGGKSHTHKKDRSPEPTPKAAELKPPDELTPFAKKFWESHAAEVARLGMLTVNDVPTFAALCEAWGTMQIAKAAMVPRKGSNVKVTTTDRAHANELRKHPAWQILRESTTLYLTLAREFGFSPSSRVGLPAPAAPDDDDDLFG